MLIKTVLLLVTVALGSLVGYTDIRAEEMQPAVLLLLSFAALLGAAFPDGAWRRGLLLGLSVPVAHVVSQLTGTVLPYPLPRFADTFLALIPAMIGSYLGVGLRRLVAPVHKEQPRG
jgi:hypothetical protein